MSLIDLSGLSGSDYSNGDSISFVVLDEREENMRKLVLNSDIRGEEQLRVYEENSRRSGFYDVCSRAYDNCEGAKILDQFENVCSRDSQVSFSCSGGCR